MPLKNKIYSKLGFKTREEKKKEFENAIRNAEKRGFDAAKHDRLRYNWTRTKTEPNALVKSDWPALNARAFDMAINNPIVAGFKLDNRVSIVGPEGFDYQPITLYADGKPDKFANKLLKRKFEAWCDEEYCTVTKRIPWVVYQYLACDALFIEGVVIARKLYAGEPVDGNPFGFTLEPLDVNDIDFSYNAELPGGDTVLMGVRLNKWRQIISIFFKEKSLYSELWGGANSMMRRNEIPYDDLIYAFDPLHYKITTGITPLAPVLITLKDMGMYENYAIQAAKFGSAINGWFYTDKDNPNVYNGPQTIAEDQNADPDLLGDLNDSERTELIGFDTEAASGEALPPGWKWQKNENNYPSDQFAPFESTFGKRTATGLNRDYASLFGDRDGESYSGGRNGELKMRAAYSYSQQLMSSLFLTRINKAWIKYALLAGALEPLQYSLRKKYERHYWQGYVKPWVDDLKQATADILREKAGHVSKNKNITKAGGNMEDNFQDKVDYEDMKKQYKVDIEADDKTKPETIIKGDENVDDNVDQNSDSQKTDKNRSAGLTVVYKM